MKKALAISALTFALPLAAAAAVNNLTDAGSLIINVINNVLVPVLFALAFIVFLYGAFQTFIWGANSEDTKTNGQNLMLYGLIGFVVMVSIWGLVNILTGTIQLGNNSGLNGGTPTAGVQVR